MNADEKSYENIHIFYIGYEVSNGEKHLNTIFNQINGYTEDMKKHGVKLNILLVYIMISQMIMMKNI